MWHQLQAALPELRAVNLIPVSKTVDCLLGVMSQQRAGKLKAGVSTVYPTTNLLHCPCHMDMIALNEYFRAGDPQRDHSSFAFWWQTASAQWWDDLGLFPAQPEVPPLHHIPDITLPMLHHICGLSWYRELANPPTFITPEPPLRTAPLLEPLTYTTPNPVLHPACPAPPMPSNFVDGLVYTVTGDALTSADYNAAW